MTSPITYLGRNDTDNTVTFAFRAKYIWQPQGRWEYFLPSRAVVDKIEYITRKVSAAKAVGIAKRTAIKQVKL